jgi:hypothetical protein
MPRTDSGNGRYRVSIKEEEIERGIRRDSRHCMISEAIKRDHPDWTRIETDLATIRWTNPRTKKRYICLTPDSARDALVLYDQGEPIEPFTIAVRPIQITPLRTVNRDSEGGRKVTQSHGRAKVKRHSNGETTIVGGKPLPKGHLSGGAQASESKARHNAKRNPPRPSAKNNVQLSSGRFRRYGLKQLRA